MNAMADATRKDSATGPQILGHMTALADLTRSRALRVLEQGELSVAELCAVLQLPQSTASRHLKLLSEEGWVVNRREGTTALYRMMLDDLEPAARKLWLLVREQIAESPAVERDELRLERVLADRQTKSQAFFSTTAGQWDKLRAELFGERFDLAALGGLLDRQWVVGDLGCGTGQVAEVLAPFVKRVVAVDSSGPMLKAARKRLARCDNVEVKRGQLESLPMDDGEMDAVLMSLVLHHVAEPLVVLREIARVLKAGGKMLLVDMLPHDHREYQQTMGHVWLGFEGDQLAEWFAEAGLGDLRVTALAAEAQAKGPALFAATARKVTANGKGRGTKGS
jgi:ubiquinone/menaquinone biosynthesis C-methylase UbiE/DNA-binding transcriptional ArsR family regulator